MHVKSRLHDWYSLVNMHDNAAYGLVIYPIMIIFLE